MHLRLTLDMIAAGPQGTAMALGLPVRVSGEEDSIFHQGRNIIRRADCEDGGQFELTSAGISISSLRICHRTVPRPGTLSYCLGLGDPEKGRIAGFTAPRSHLQLLASHGLQRHAEVERRDGDLRDLLERVDLRKTSTIAQPGFETTSSPTMHFLMILTPSMCAPVTCILR